MRSGPEKGVEASGIKTFDDAVHACAYILATGAVRKQYGLSDLMGLRFAR